MSPLTRREQLTAHEGTALWFAANGRIPNNSALPVVVYAQAIAAHEASAEAFERLFARNAWPPQWRNGIYDFHHFHSTAHEALGIASGTADLILGGPNGQLVEVGAGACVILPAGTGHCLLSGSADLLVVGAYPPGQVWDLQRDAISQAQLNAMHAFPLPSSDPVNRETGLLLSLWSGA